MEKSDFFYYICPHCNTKFICPSGYENKIISCSKCKNEIVPTRDTITVSLKNQSQPMPNKAKSEQVQKKTIPFSNKTTSTYKEPELISSLKRESKISFHLAIAIAVISIILAISLASPAPLLGFIFSLIFYMVYRIYAIKAEFLGRIEKSVYITAENSSRIIELLQKIADK